MENIRHQFPNLEIFYIPEYIVIVHCIFCFILNSKSLSFTCSQSVVFIRCTTRYHLLSFVITRCITRCPTRCHSFSYLLSFVAPLVVIRCTSLPFVVTRCTTRCHLLSLDVLLVCLFKNDHQMKHASINL